jgi:hypothetical protein
VRSEQWGERLDGVRKRRDRFADRQTRAPTRSAVDVRRAAQAHRRPANQGGRTNDPHRRRHRHLWRRGPPVATTKTNPDGPVFRCIQPTFPSGSVAGLDLIFIVQSVAPRNLVVTRRHFTSY